MEIVMMKYLLILFSMVSYTFATQENYSEIEYPKYPNIDKSFYNSDTSDPVAEYYEYENPYNMIDYYPLYPEEITNDNDNTQYQKPKKYKLSEIDIAIIPSPERTYNYPIIEMTEQEFYDLILQDYYKNILQTTTNIYNKIQQDYYYNSNISQIVNNIYTQLPKKEQDLIRLAILDYELEKQRNYLYFLPAVNNILAQKKLLSYELTNTMQQPLSSDSEQIRLKSLIQVIIEKEIMISNLIIFQKEIDKKLYQNLREKIATIINEWLYNELIKPPHTRVELLKTLNIIFNDNK